MSVATVVSGSNGRMMSSHPSLLESTVVTDGFYSSLLCYHCINVVVATGRMPINTMAYGPLLQLCVVVV
jgi:hypothetical protein